MDDLEAVFNLNTEKACGVLNISGNLIIFTIVTTVSVFSPLAITLSKDSPELMDTFKYFMIFIPMIIIPILSFFFFKYREYKNDYRLTLIKSIVKNYFVSSDNNPNPPNSDTICKEIVHITGDEYNEVMEMLFKIYPPPKTLPIITK